MAMPKIAGYPNFPYDSSDANNSAFTPVLFSDMTIKKYYNTAVVPQITNSDAQDHSKILGVGSKVVFRTRPTVTVSKYYKGKTIKPEILESPKVELDIARAWDFSFGVNDIDIKQMSFKYFDECSEDASHQLMETIETEFFSTVYADAASTNKGATAGAKTALTNLGAVTAPVVLTKTNILDTILDCEMVAEEAKWPNDGGRWIAFPPYISTLIKRSDLKDASLTGEDKSPLLRREFTIGRFSSFIIYNSNLLTSVTDTGLTCFNIMFGHKDAICYVAQLVKTDYHDKPESGFEPFMKGLTVADWKVIKPDALGVLYATRG